MGEIGRCNNEVAKLDAIYLYADTVAPRNKRFHGEIRSYDGDRVMGIFTGRSKNSSTVKDAEEMKLSEQGANMPEAHTTDVGSERMTIYRSTYRWSV
ncbi:hypothetical protein [Streptomyces sp. NBC_00019]|uniref:hypothetical protein n=1 Tax=Streptomyces sp. NBC_00019 TaxID=2975623 RepID=UPI00324E3593